MEALTHWNARGAIEKRRWFDFIGYEPHEGQWAFHENRARFRVCPCGWGWGKTTAAARDYEPLFLTPNTVGWIVAPTYVLGEKPFRVFYNDLVSRFGRDFFAECKYNPKVEMKLKLREELGGSVIEVKTERHPESLEGEDVDYVIFEEASLMKLKTFERVYGRLRMGGEACFLFTPDGFNWTYDLYKHGDDPEYADWWSRRGPSHDNPHLEAEWLENVQRDLTPESYESKILGRFRTNVGYVLADFDENVHISDFGINPTWPLYSCIDYGYTNPFVFLLVQQALNGQIRICREYYATHQGLETHGDYISHLYKGHPKWNWQRPIIDDPGGAQERVELAKYLPKEFRKLHGVQREREVAVELVRHLFQPLGDAPGILIDRRCRQFIDECQKWRYPERKSDREADELPLKANDHGPEALSRLLAYLSGAKRMSDLKPEVGGDRIF